MVHTGPSVSAAARTTLGYAVTAEKLGGLGEESYHKLVEIILAMQEAGTVEILREWEDFQVWQVVEKKES